MSKQPLPIGHILQNKYQIKRVLGDGGFGITYLGQDKNTWAFYAVKEYFPAGAYRLSHRVVLSDSQSLLKGFIHEVRAFLRLRNCPNIAHIHDIFEENDTLYMVFDYVEGSTLYDRVQKAGRISPWECIGYMEDIAKALFFTHNQQLLHRDVTPNNIIITPSEQAVLIDFGAARLYENRTQAITSVLNPGYAPPEQYLKEARYSPALDIYSFGASFYHALVGEKPPNALERYAAASKGKPDPLIHPSQQRNDIPPCVGDIIYKCMKVKEEERYPDMSAVLTRIAECKQKLKPPPTASTLNHKSSTVNSSHQTSPLLKNQEMRFFLILLALTLLGFGVGLVLARWL